MKRPIPGRVLIILLATSSTAQAGRGEVEDLRVRMESFFHRMSTWVEPIVPDVGVERVVGGPLALRLGYPVHVYRGAMPIEHFLDPTDVRTWTLFVEPQVAALAEDEHEYRVLAGARLWSKPGWGVGVEGGAVAGTDGVGGFVGVTVGHTATGRDVECLRTARLLDLRLVMVDEAVRLDASIDLAYFRQCAGS